jgi:hypothetical protein
MTKPANESVDVFRDTPVRYAFMPREIDASL